MGALFTVGHLYGQQKLMNKMLVDAKREKRRMTRSLELWQSKLLQKAGVPGGLYKRVFTDTEPLPPAHRVVSPSQAISDLKKEMATGIKQKIVPSSIGNEFLADAGQFASINNGDNKPF